YGAWTSAVNPLSMTLDMSDELSAPSSDQQFAKALREIVFALNHADAPARYTLAQAITINMIERREVIECRRRLAAVADAAAEQDVRCLIDAEHLRVQEGIDWFALSTALKYNKQSGSA